MSNEEVKNKYGDMAGSWRGKNVLVRNAIIALENIGYIDDEIVEYLMENKSELLKPYIARYITKFSSK
jgi:epoxyqueuosine reductase